LAGKKDNRLPTLVPASPAWEKKKKKRRERATLTRGVSSATAREGRNPAREKKGKGGRDLSPVQRKTPPPTENPHHTQDERSGLRGEGKKRQDPSAAVVLKGGNVFIFRGADASDLVRGEKEECQSPPSVSFVKHQRKKKKKKGEKKKPWNG